MATSDLTTIKLKSYLDIQKEAVAASAITPGMLVELDSDGKFKAHDSAGQNVLTIVAIENALEGETIDDAYEADDIVRGWFPQRGEEALLMVKDGENVTAGDFLESDGNGYVQVHSADSAGVYPNQIVGQALEDLDLSGSSAAESSGGLDYPYNRIQVLIM